MSGNPLICCSVLFTTLLVAFAPGCEGDDETGGNDGVIDTDTTTNPLAGTGPYVMLTIVGESRFFGVVDSLAIGNYDVNQAHEVQAMFIQPWGRRVFLIPAETAANEVLVFDVAADNSIAQVGTITAPPSSYPADVMVVNETTAYLSLLDLGQVWAFNPTTLQVTAQIDLAPYAVDDNDPETPPDASPEPTSMAVKDGKLYVALNQSYNMSMMGRDGMYMAIVNMATNTVEKIVEDTSRGYAYAGRHGGSGDCTFVDEQGDLYTVSMASWGWAPGQRPGFLRIKAGEEVFDPNWEFDLSAFNIQLTSGETVTANYLLQVSYGGNGIVYASAHIPAHESDPPDWVNDRQMSFIRIDLYNKTIEALPFPDTNTYSSDIFLDGNLVIAEVMSEAGNGIYAYDTVTESMVGNPAIVVQGWAHMISPLN